MKKKIRIATVDRCVMCGEIIPEGKQVCGLCKHKTELEETINEFKKGKPPKETEKESEVEK